MTHQVFAVWRVILHGCNRVFATVEKSDDIIVSYAVNSDEIIPLRGLLGCFSDN